MGLKDEVEQIVIHFLHLLHLLVFVAKFIPLSIA